MSTFKISGTTFHVDRKYQPIKALGQGAYGVVCAAKDRSNGTKVAIKRINPMAVNSVVAKQALREIRLLRHLGRHSNIIALKDLSVREADDELYVIMELMDTDLHRIIQSSQTLTDAHHKHFMYQLIRGLNFAHKHGVIHRDLKPSNLLVSKNCDLVITDFGLSRLAPEEEDALMTEHVVTRWYRPPELMLCADGNYTSAVDMWSVGCIFAELLGRKPLFPGKNFMHQLCLIFEVIGTPPKSELGFIKSEQAMTFMRGLDTIEKTPFKVLFPYANPKAVDLLEQCLKFTPGERITVEEALEHPYFASVASQYTDPDPVLDETFEFEFENQKLRKGDLRQLIVEEVKSFRAEVAGKKPRRTSSSSTTSGGAPAPGSGAGTGPSGRSTSRGRSRERGSYTRGTAASRSRSRGSRGRSGSRGSSSSLLAKAEADRARRRSGSRDSRGSRGSTGSGSMRRSHSARDRSSSNPRAARRGSSTARDARGRDDPGGGERGRGGGIRDSVSGSAASRVIGADAAMNPHHSRRGQHPTTTRNPHPPSSSSTSSSSRSRMATTNPTNQQLQQQQQQGGSTRSRTAAHKTSTTSSNNHPSHRRAPSSAWSEAGTGIRGTSTAAAPAPAPASSSAARRSSPYKTASSSPAHPSPSRSRPPGHATSPDVAASPRAAAAEPPSPPTAQQQQQLPPKPAPAFTDPPSPQRKPGRRTGNAAASPRRGYPSPSSSLAHSRGAGGGMRSGAPPPSPARRAAAAPSAWSPPAAIAGLASSSAAVAAAIAASPRRPGAAATSSAVPPSPSVSPVNTAQAKTQPLPSPAVRRAVASAAVLRPSPSRGMARSASSPATRKSPPSFTKAQQRRQQQQQHRQVAGVDMLEGDDDEDEDGAGLDALLGSVGVAGRGLIPTPRPASTSSPARRASPRASPAAKPPSSAAAATLHSRVEEAAAAAEAALARNPASYQFRSGVTVPRPFNFATSRRTRSSRSLATSGAGEPSAAAAAAPPAAAAQASARAVTAAGADRSSVLRRQGSGGVTSRHTTAVKPFNFATSSRQRSREQLTHAAAHPRGYAAGTASSKGRRKRTTTVARSPQFSKMSWQKRAGSRPSGTTTSGSAAGSTAAARARRARSAARTRSTRVY